MMSIQSALNGMIHFNSLNIYISKFIFYEIYFENICMETVP